MASIASTSAAPSLTTLEVDPRPQAGPLPSKCGEIGYREDDGRDLERGSDEGDGRSIMMLPPHHPADRDAHEASATVQSGPAVDGAVPTPSQNPEVLVDASSTHSKSGKRSIISFFAPRSVPTFGGIRLTTFLLFIAQLLFAGGTIVAWVLVVRRIRQSTQQSQDGDSENSGGLQLSSSAIFIHVVLAITLLGQFIFIERRLYRLRAERYFYLHPGEMLPTSRRTSSGSMGISPWNRPPLPTYAATLAQSGHGTGDVEDNIIAVPPPPAYGNNRGSRLLLQGYLRDSLRAQRPISEHSQSSQRDGSPISYTPHDEEWQEVRDAERARQLEEALSKLEEGDIGLSRSSAVTRGIS